ncbi:hypothetical protein [Ferruginibacter albus]|uniref:hypothetical protein n=1 Tax=Ferruginibacter albus TaxID=2875540 RepID=UPI001CC7727E|nr:hypothetical protein [Ferruginibacter albus]UAY53195.1 hypothetical protein K9M53_05865 [Ferruginibacter albus]
MIDQILNIDNWQLVPMEKQVAIAKQNSEKKENLPAQGWQNISRTISPLALYKYLNARFGPPNGFVMFLKNPTSDNIIHWQYALSTKDSFINIWGKTSVLEFSIKTSDNTTLSNNDWDALVSNIKKDFKKYDKEMKEVQSKFEQWSLFINPFTRIEHTLQGYIQQLEKLNLEEVQTGTPKSKEDINKYQKDLEKWTKNISKAASLGTTIRMLCPVMAESFINLILLVFRKDEYKNDERLYEGLIRDHIDIRVKTLHLHCTCFPNQIDYSSNAFKKFHTLMNKRNDFLHGNIDPYKLIVEDVWFDQNTIPLFENDEGMIRRMMRNYCTNVERSKAIEDFQTISDLIELILMAMDSNSLKIFVQLMSDRMPGINKKTKRLGVLFPSDKLVEGFVY